MAETLLLLAMANMHHRVEEKKMNMILTQHSVCPEFKIQAEVVRQWKIEIQNLETIIKNG